ncbi:MAG: hypothetical protein ACXABD_06055 [Candidatus Thorarchaeota archaeon]|jgi:hypothetical protein
MTEDLIEALKNEIGITDDDEYIVVLGVIACDPSTSDDVYDAIVNFTDASVVKIAEMTSEEDQKTALLCHLLGHKWKTGPGDHTASDSRKWFRKYCERCGEVVVK